MVYLTATELYSMRRWSGCTRAIFLRVERREEVQNMMKREILHLRAVLMMISLWAVAPSTTVMAPNTKETFRDQASMDLASCGTKQAFSSMRACGRIINLMVKGWWTTCKGYLVVLVVANTWGSLIRVSLMGRVFWQISKANVCLKESGGKTGRQQTGFSHAIFTT